MNDPEHKISVIVVDDHSLFRAGVRTALSVKKDIELIAEADNGVQLFKALDKIVPDVVLLDIQMPIMDGIQALYEIKKTHPNVKVIILSMHSDRTMIRKLMEIGANAYLTKNSSSDVIYEAIKSCYEHNSFGGDMSHQVLKTDVRDSRMQPMHADDLTEKELDLLKLMCEERTTIEIADIMNISPRTVEALRDRLKMKTGAKSMAGLIMYAAKNGIIDQQ